MNGGVDFSVDLQDDGDRLVLLVRGELDEHTGERLVGVTDDVLTKHSTKTLLIDLSGVGFMDSRGLGQLLYTCRSVERAGRQVFVVNPSLHAQRVLDSAGLGNHLLEP
jgi:stage II sporulation protein AA (anti-sigma F factor antagonist)